MVQGFAKGGETVATAPSSTPTLTAPTMSSGDPPYLQSQRYTSYLGMAQTGRATKRTCMSDRQTYTLPPLHEVAEPTSNGLLQSAHLPVSLEALPNQQLHDIQNYQVSSPRTLDVISPSSRHLQGASRAVLADSSGSLNNNNVEPDRDCENAELGNHAWNNTGEGSGYQDLEVYRNDWDFDFPMPSFCS